VPAIMCATPVHCALLLLQKGSSQAGGDSLAAQPRGEQCPQQTEHLPMTQAQAGAQASIAAAPCCCCYCCCCCVTHCHGGTTTAALQLLLGAHLAPQ
jgi:hypothetical protein